MTRRPERRRRPARAVALAALLAAGVAAPACSGDGGDEAADAASTTASTTAAPPTTGAGGDAAGGAGGGSDRVAPTVPPGAAVLAPEQCAALFEAIRVLTVPVTAAGDREAELEQSLAVIDAAAAADPGYPAEVLALLREGLVQEEGAVVEDGLAGWQDALVERRSGEEAADLELQLENLRAYVSPRC